MNFLIRDEKTFLWKYNWRLYILKEIGIYVKTYVKPHKA